MTRPKKPGRPRKPDALPSAIAVRLPPDMRVRVDRYVVRLAKTYPDASMGAALRMLIDRGLTEEGL